MALDTSNFSPSEHQDSEQGIFRNRVTHLLGTGLLAGAVGCSGGVDDPSDGGPEQTFFTCEATGDASAVPVSEWAITPAYTAGTLESVEDSNADSHELDLDYAAEAPLNQSTFYRCEFTGGDNCFFTVNPLPGTMYEAAHMETGTFLKWQTNWINGETTPQGSDQSLATGDVALVHVVSTNPAGNGSYPVNITLNPECE